MPSMAGGGDAAFSPGPISIADAARSLKQPIVNGLRDARMATYFWVSKRRKLLAGDVEGALDDEARLIVNVQHARESLSTYHRIRTLIEKHSEELADHQPDDRLPEQLVLFVGQSRSGHSLVGSLIDAHPDAVIAHELHALKHLLAGADIGTLSRAIQLNARLFDLIGRAYSGYDYQVEGQWQGRHRDLLVIGDKKGNGTTRLLRRHPRALDELEARLGIPLRLINVVRHPLDNIATKARRTGVSVTEAARRFLANAHTLDGLTQDRPGQVRTVYLDELIDAPRTVLSGLITWLGLPSATSRYLDACAERLFDRPKRTREQVDWPAGLVDRLRTDFARFSALARFADQPGSCRPY